MDFVGGVGIPDDELSILRRGHQMTTVGGPVHGVNLGQMSLQRATGLHSNTRQCLCLILCDLADCYGITSQSEESRVQSSSTDHADDHSIPTTGVKRKNSEREGEGEPVREASANSSFLRLILSFRPSASRRAAVILACICSPLISAVILWTR